MRFKTFSNLKRLIRYAERFVAEVDTVSFDLFDTLFIRRIHNPDMVKPAVARFIALKAQLLGSPYWTWEKVQGVRDRVENEQRARTGEQFDDHEARYPDFMRQTLSEIFKERMSDDLLQEITDYELAIENAMIVPRSELVVWIRKLYQQQKKILIVSDIYFPSDHLKKLIEHAGLIEFVTDVISSADTFLAKASGKAFPMIQKRYSLDTDRWLHIGDNPISDGLRPVEFGIRSLLIKDTSEKRRKTIAQIYTVFSNRRLYWKGRLLQQLMLPLEGENNPRSPLYIEGYNFLAPLVGVFVQRIAERTRELDVGRIYFLSREGWTFKKFWKRALPLMLPADLLPEVSYLYVSRLALAGASCAHWGLTQSKADIAFLPPGNRDFCDLCRVFSLDILGLRPFLKRHGLKEDDPLSPIYPGGGKFRQKFMYLIEDPDFQSEVKKQTLPFNDALQQYLEREGFFNHQEVALVDVGWTGTIQRLLYEAVAHRGDKPRFHGFLFGASRGISFPTLPDNYVEGVIYDRDKFDFAGSTIMYNREFFEEAFRAPHAGLNGYRLKENGFDLVFRDDKDAYSVSESKQNDHFLQLKQGILDAATRFGAASAILGFSFEDLKPWLRYLMVSKIAFPKTKEVKMIKHKFHMDDFYGKHKPPEAFLKYHKNLWDYSFSALRWNPWLRMKYYLFKNRSV